MKYGIVFISTRNPELYVWTHEVRTNKIYGRFTTTNLNEAYIYRQYCVDCGESGGRYHVKEYLLEDMHT